MSLSVMEQRMNTMMTPKTSDLFHAWVYSQPRYNVKSWTPSPSSSSFPETYDRRKKLCPVMDQGGCGSCTYFAVIGLLSDMVSIQRKQPVIPLSVQYVLECVYQCFEKNKSPSTSTLSPIEITCNNGSDPEYIMAFLKRISASGSRTLDVCGKNGTVAATCRPYAIEHTPLCQRKRSIKTQIYVLSILGGIELLLILTRILFLGKSTMAFNQRIDSMILVVFAMVFFIVLVACIFFIYRKKNDNASSITQQQAMFSKYLLPSISITLMLLGIACYRALFQYDSTTGIYFRNIIFILLLFLIVGCMILLTFFDVFQGNNETRLAPLKPSSCNNECVNAEETMTRYYVRDIYQIPFSTSTSLQDRITILKTILSTIGPIGVVITPRMSFFGIDMFRPGHSVYDPEKKGGLVLDGGHVVCIIGWHKDAWIIRNSWGPCWGDNGYCYWKMGSDKIEDHCFFLTAADD